MLGHDAHAAQGMVRMAKRQTDDVRVAPLVPRDERAARTLDVVRAGLAERLSGREERFDAAGVGGLRPDPRTDGEADPSASDTQQRHRGPDDVLAAGEPVQHRPRVPDVTWLAKDLPVDEHKGVGPERDPIPSRDSLRLREGRLGKLVLVDPGRHGLELHPQCGQQLDAAGRRGGEPEHGATVRARDLACSYLDMRHQSLDTSHSAGEKA